jgi:hypothetical protein
MAAVDMNVLKRTRATASSHCLRTAIERKPDSAQRAHELAIGGNNLPVLSRPASPRRWRRDACIAERLQIAAGDPRRLRIQRLIDLTSQLPPRHHIGDGRGDDEGCRDSSRRD